MSEDQLQERQNEIQRRFQDLQQQLQDQGVRPPLPQPNLPDAGNDAAPGLQAPHVHRVSVKLPPFWREKPGLWFAQVEAQFTTAGITHEQTKYSYVVSHLEERYANEVEDLIVNPPINTPYTILKSELIRRLSVSEERRVRQLLTEENLGDKTPSQYLRHLRSLVGPVTISDNLLRTIWLQRLPAHVQGILQPQIVQPYVTNASLAITADKIMEVQPNSHSFPTVEATSIHPTSNSHVSSSGRFSSLAELSQQLSALQSEMISLRNEVQQMRHDPPKSPRRSANDLQHRHRSKSPPNTVCWYHRRFGQQASKCLQPCTFNRSTNFNGSQ